MKKIILFLMAGLLISFAWPVRGQFGHEWGAMIPGALSAFVACVLISDLRWRQVFAQAVFLGSIGFCFGGEFGYGSIVNAIVASPSLADVIPQLIQVFFMGAIWGGLGMTFLGFGIGELEVLIQDVLVLAFAGIGSYLAVEVFKLGGSNIYWYAGSIAVTQIYNSLFKKSNIVTLFGAYGFLGFGLGFLISVLILWCGTQKNWSGGWWLLRDQIWGGIGGFSVILASLQAQKKGYVPVVMQNVNWQRAGFVMFMVVVTGWNTWNVYTKWFQSTPIVSNPQLWSAFLIGCAILLAAFLIYFLFCSQDVYQRQLNKTLLWTSLFFCIYLATLAIMKSIVYSGMSAWETGFSLFVVELIIFILTFPSIVLNSQK